MSYCPNTPEDIREMLAAIGVASVDALFAPIPAGLRARSFALPDGTSEQELLRQMKQLAGTDRPVTGFIGGGYYDHYIPAVVDHLSGRAEFYTAYTPYQPECSQGTLQALFEYQTAICRLTGMEVSNASLYDGGTALAEAAMMALRVTGRNRLVIDGSVNPFSREIVRTYLTNLGVEIVEIPARDGLADRPALTAALTDLTAAVILQNPNFFGSVEDLSDIALTAHANGALLIASVYPISLGLVKSPGAMGADIVVGDGQSLGNPLSFGGPSFGFIATTKKYIRNLPGRIIGETVDKSGRRGFVLTLQAREQHIKRHKATSNICSNQSLCALRGMIFLASVGKEGLVDLARLNRDKAEYAKGLLGSIKGVKLLNTAPTFNEFTIVLPKDAAEVAERLLGKGVAAGVPLGAYYHGMDNCLVVTVTEKRTRDEIDALAKELEGAL
ncbi:aminomethyl-transferring glycine dehydrogenase subunit GcvPA [Geotalea uraniireducens]|uniref:Probable glycine dehydrogenase (decarboxylating) subunit 1 n=1 Tax=Geotalea uraniireducens (strain Rf4) TaxID=351605 RepID=GCSPA_GEOUR|nr:aminomethyl-transferring glycine dehydrogenase subunit GcvPA [Geotalea uraniireducens]A5GCZ8.1 RecName: Full=Probable glycine dehydrogenase (decarboxylating) subunit 1; AltName: Full=Glycine cleavage system P-protein subunit 1; AltName: Full=Glycine decarboxylase subunit 1; AltName: Full=Glycine dehydrogenase (aminomethyl-transferring) subunit 1 [Geotalea uraniireducens Rf4]ABQ24553.1 glycine dehydrogenase (decarboxylating) alpha subunit [Geotalea uraniireducens Rf4]